MHEGVQVQPLVLGPAIRRGALPPRGPDPTHDRLEAQSGLILGPQLHRPVGVGPAKLVQATGQAVFSTPAAPPGWPPPGSWAGAPGARGRADAARPNRSAWR